MNMEFEDWSKKLDDTVTLCSIFCGPGFDETRIIGYARELNAFLNCVSQEWLDGEIARQAKEQLAEHVEPLKNGFATYVSCTEGHECGLKKPVGERLSGRMPDLRPTTFRRKIYARWWCDTFRPAAERWLEIPAGSASRDNAAFLNKKQSAVCFHRSRVCRRENCPCIAECPAPLWKSPSRGRFSVLSRERRATAFSTLDSARQSNGRNRAGHFRLS